MENSESGSAARRTAVKFLRETGVSPELILRLAFAIEQGFAGVSEEELQMVYDEAQKAVDEKKINHRWVRFATYLREVYARAGLPWEKVRSPSVCRLDGITVPELEKPKKPAKPTEPEMTPEEVRQAQLDFAAACREQLGKIRSSRAVEAALAESNSARKKINGELTFDEIIKKGGFKVTIAGADKTAHADDEGGESWVNGIVQDAKQAVAPDLSHDNQEVPAEIGQRTKGKRTKIKPGVAAFASKYVDLPEVSPVDAKNG